MDKNIAIKTLAIAAIVLHLESFLLGIIALILAVVSGEILFMFAAEFLMVTSIIGIWWLLKLWKPNGRFLGSNFAHKKPIWRE